jgi:hypothetical protein
VGHDHLVGVSIDDQIGIVRHDNDLTAMLGRAETFDQFLEDGFWIGFLRAGR